MRVEVPRDADQPASGQVTGGDDQRPGELFGLVASAQVAEGAHTQVTEQAGEQLFEIGPPVDTVGHQEREPGPDQGHPPDQIAVQNLPVVDAAHHLPEPGQRFTGGLQGGDQRRDDRARAGARDTGKPVAGRGQRVHRPDQPDTPNTTAFTNRVDTRRAHGRHDAGSWRIAAARHTGQPRCWDALEMLRRFEGHRRRRNVSVRVPGADERGCPFRVGVDRRCARRRVDRLPCRTL
jgi:hypothetical protein